RPPHHTEGPDHLAAFPATDPDDRTEAGTGLAPLVAHTVGRFVPLRHRPAPVVGRDPAHVDAGGGGLLRRARIRFLGGRLAVGVPRRQLVPVVRRPARPPRRVPAPGGGQPTGTRSGPLDIAGDTRRSGARRRDPCPGPVPPAIPRRGRHRVFHVHCG